MKKLIVLFLTISFLTSCFKKEIVEEKKTENKVEQKVHSAKLVNNNRPILDSTHIVIDSAAIAVLKMDYSTAKNTNTSEGWEKFLEDNPNYKNKKEIEDNIIRAKVNEISNSRDTGAMPESEKTSKGNFKTSTILVENDTSCDLILRYSGTEAKIVNIPANSKSKISILSGNYTVAATACDYNYAGKETLNGDYSVVYYISTTRY